MTGSAPGDPLSRGADADRWLADARAEEAANERRRERTRRMIASGETDLIGIVRAFSGTGERVVVITGAGSRSGTVDFVGRDFLTVAADDVRVFVPLDAVVAVRSAAQAGEPAPPGRDLSLGAALADLVGDGPRAQISTAAGRLTGVLAGVGTDVVVLRLDGPDAGVAHVAINSILELALLG